MSAQPRRLRYPSSGPFIGAIDPGGPPPEVGDGTPGLIYRYLGDVAQQTFPNAGPSTQDMLFRSYDLLSNGVSAPAFPHEIATPKWVDFDLYLPWFHVGTTSVTVLLYLTNQVGEVLARQFAQQTCGDAEMAPMYYSERLLWLPGTSPVLRYSSFRVEIEAVADATDVVLDNPNAWARFTTYIAPDGV